MVYELGHTQRANNRLGELINERLMDKAAGL